MKKLFQFFLKLIIFIILTALTQIGGLVYLIALLLTSVISKKIQKPIKFKRTLVFIVCYLFATFIIVPIMANMLGTKYGRERVKHHDNLKPATYMTVLLNRNYVRPELNQLLANTAQDLQSNPKTSAIQINYLDANFPFINGFPLLPHLSHNDGKKIDLSYVYQTSDGQISTKQKSITGFGVFIEPTAKEINTTKRCKSKGYWQYDYPKYFKVATINQQHTFSKTGSKQLIHSLLKNQSLGKIFVEPHLVKRMRLKQGGNSKIRFQGCHSVRHDDHIHIQLK